MPQYQSGTFEPVTIPKGQRRMAGLDQAIISLYAKGLTTGDIATHLEDVTGQRIDRSTISRITDAIVDDLTAWQSAEAAENRDLRRRVKLLEQENKVLRRAAAYLSQANLDPKGSSR